MNKTLVSENSSLISCLQEQKAKNQQLSNIHHELLAIKVDFQSLSENLHKERCFNKKLVSENSDLKDLLAREKEINQKLSNENNKLQENITQLEFNTDLSTQPKSPHQMENTIPDKSHKLFQTRVTNIMKTEICRKTNHNSNQQLYWLATHYVKT